MRYRGIFAVEILKYKAVVKFMRLYHGSNTVVDLPKILTNGFYKDFGYGFYCTILEKQARRWALTKKKQDRKSTRLNSSH